MKNPQEPEGHKSSFVSIKDELVYDDSDLQNDSQTHRNKQSNKRMEGSPWRCITLKSLGGNGLSAGGCAPTDCGVFQGGVERDRGSERERGREKQQLLMVQSRQAEARTGPHR